MPPKRPCPNDPDASDAPAASKSLGIPSSALPAADTAAPESASRRPVSDASGLGLASPGRNRELFLTSVSGFPLRFHYNLLRLFPDHTAAHDVQPVVSRSGTGHQAQPVGCPDSHLSGAEGPPIQKAHLLG